MPLAYVRSPRKNVRRCKRLALRSASLIVRYSRRSDLRNVSAGQASEQRHVSKLNEQTGPAARLAPQATRSRAQLAQWVA